MTFIFNDINFIRIYYEQRRFLIVKKVIIISSYDFFKIGRLNGSLPTFISGFQPIEENGRSRLKVNNQIRGWNSLVK